MDTFLIQLGTMSVQASVAILVVLLLRKIFASAGVSKKYVMLLWVIPFVMLICPWKISSPVGLWGDAPSDYDAEYTEYQIERFAEQFVQVEVGEVEVAIDGDTASGGNTSDAASIIWLAGMCAFLIYAVVSYVQLQKKVRCCVQKADNIYCVDDLPVPMVMGFLQPKIFLPSGMPEEHVAYVVEHENTHIRRNDPFLKLIAYVIVCVHWFNPMVWLAYHFLEKDMEMACDEETIQRIGTERKKEYATALLQLSVGTRRVFAVPLAFGEGDTKGRIKNVMHYKKTVKAAAILAVAAGVLILAVFMTKSDQAEQSVLSDSEQELAEQEKEKLGELTLDMVREAAANHTLHELDFLNYSNGEEYDYGEDALSYHINFYFDYEGERYRLDTSHMKDEFDRLDVVYLWRESDNEVRWIYSYDNGAHNYSENLEPMLATKVSIDDWLTVELPEGYTLGTYNAAYGYMGGALIYPQAYEVYGEDVFAPADWYHAGFVGRLPDAQDHFQFIDGKLQEHHGSMYNHSEAEFVEVLDLDWQTVLMHYNLDLYTAAGQYELEESGIDISQIDVTSDYWYFFFVKEGEDDAYYLSLSSKLFTKEEAIAIAETVDIVE